MGLSMHRCKVIVVGTGAGGAVAGAVLAQAGIDTILVEEGKAYVPQDHGTPLESLARMYLNSGFTAALGAPPVPLMVGRAVGGTTLVNSATCFRPPRAKVDAWEGITWNDMVPVLDAVEERINAHPLDTKLLGGNWRVLKRGCEAKGVEIKPLMHNVRDCEGRGRCAFGCPTGAKQSMDMTFIPDALAAGARLLTEHRVDDVLVENGRAVGVRGKSPEGRFEIMADAVVLAMGAISGPAFMLRTGLANSSGLVGRGLHIHPGARVVAEFDETVDGFAGVPQGAYIDHWTDHGIMLEGVFTPPGPLIASLPGIGRGLKTVAARYRNMSAFGVMVSDTSSGRVHRPWLGARFPVTYRFNQADAETMRFGIARLVELYLAAGARKVYANFTPSPIVFDEEGLKALEAAPVKPRYFGMVGFHPLGTCRLGAKPSKSVVNHDLQTHDVPGLYIMDGSVIPESLGVNPQVTIMALAMHGAKGLAERLGSG